METFQVSIESKPIIFTVLINQNHLSVYPKNCYSFTFYCNYRNMLVLKNFWKGAHKIQEGYTQNMQKQKPLCSSLKFFICFQSLESISVINRGITFIKLAPSMPSKGSKLLKEQNTFRLIPSSPLVPTSLTSKSFHLYWLVCSRDKFGLSALCFIFKYKTLRMKS